MQFYWLDRIAFLLLVFVVLLRALVLRRRLTIAASGHVAHGGIVDAGAWAAFSPSRMTPQSWSVFAAKWVVPFALYHLAGSVFDNPASLRRFETFALIVLGYLCLIAILFLFGAKGFIFPRYILDESLGIHADRARGPFLQAVANGVTLNLLGLIALDSFRRGRLKGAPPFCCDCACRWRSSRPRPAAVWLSFAGCIPTLFFFLPAKGCAGLASA